MLVVVCWFSSFGFSCWCSGHLLHFLPQAFSTDLFPHSTAGAVTAVGIALTCKAFVVLWLFRNDGRLDSWTCFKTKELRAKNLLPTSRDYVIITSSCEQNWKWMGSECSNVALVVVRITMFFFRRPIRFEGFIFVLETRSCNTLSPFKLNSMLRNRKKNNCELTAPQRHRWMIVIFNVSLIRISYYELQKLYNIT